MFRPLFKILLVSGISFSDIRPAESNIITGAPPATLQSGNWSSLKLTWTTPEIPPSDTATPIGNGHIGARISGAVAVDTLQLNDKTFWSGGPTSDENSNRVTALNLTRQKLLTNDLVGADTAAQGMWGTDPMGVYLPLGNLTLSFDNNAGYTGYSRTLDLDQDVVTTTYTIGSTNFTRQTFASYPDNVIVMQLTSSAAGAITFTAQLAYPTNMQGHGASVTTLGTNVLVMDDKAPFQSNPSEQWDTMKGMTSESRLQILTTGGGVTANGNSLRVTNATSVVLIFANATSWNGPFNEPGTNGVNPVPVVQNTLSNAVAKGYTSLFNAHLADRQNLFRRVWVDVDGQSPNAYALGFQYARWEMISVSRDDDRPHNQQGMWNKDWNPTSEGAHWLNENVEKYYSLIEPANLGDCGEPLWEWMHDLAVHGTNTARIDWNFNGWFAPQRSDAWCLTTLQPGNNEWAIWPMGGTWICQNLWEHYAFSCDTNFLATRAYPIIKGAASFVLDLLQSDGHGHLLPSPSTSPENRFQTANGDVLAVCMGSTIDLALTRQLFQNCINAARILNVDSNFSLTLQTNLAQLLPFQISTNLPGELQEWSQDFYRPSTTVDGGLYNPHRHASMDVAVWPLSQITELGTPALFQAAKTALINRGTGGYHPDKGAMFARLKSGDLALASNNSFPTGGNNLVGKFPPKYAGFVELLLQSHTDAIELLPALPTAFTNGNAYGLCARGGYTVSLQWTNYQLAACQIYSPFGTTPLVRYQGALLNLATDSRVTLTLPPNTPPGPPPGFAAVGGIGQVSLSWSAAGTATGYFIGRGTSSYGPFSLIATNLSGLAFTDTNVTDGVTYFYVAASTNSFGEGANSAPVSAMPFAAVAAPSGLAVVAASAYEIDLSWTDNATNETGFQVWQATDGINFAPLATTGAEVTNFSNTGLLPGTTYYYRVDAFSNYTNSDYSAIASATTLSGPPPAPTGLTATPGNAQVLLSWNPAIGAIGYVLERSLTNDGPYSAVANLTATSYLDTNLTNGTTYFYVVAATNSFGPGSNSIVASATPSILANAALVWTGSNNSAWDTANLNWLNGSTATAYADGNNVLFNNSGVSPAVFITSNVFPDSVTFNNSSINYTVGSGGAGISGSTSVLKSNSGIVTFTNANAYAGGLTINGGIVSLSAANGSASFTGALGTGTVTVNSGGELMFAPPGGGAGKTPSTFTNNFILNGGLVYGNDGQEHLTGTIAVSSATTLLRQWNNNTSDQLKALLLDGLLSGSAALNLYGTGGSASSGARIWIDNPNNTYSGTITVNASAALAGFSAPAGGFSLGIGSNNALQFATVNLQGTQTSGATDPTEVYGLQFLGGVTAPVLGALQGSGTINLDTFATVTPVALTVGGNNASTTFSGVLTDVTSAGSLIKNGTGTFILTGTNNTYSGGTTINGGILQVNNPAGSGTGSGAVNVNSGGTLGGTGIITGAVTVNSGGALAPGNSLGTLTISNNLTLVAGSTTFMQIQHSPLTNDMVKISGTLTAGGTLNVTNIGAGAFANGDTFKLFNVVGYSGSFTGFVLPPLMGNLVWNTNTLKNSGTLSVVALAPPSGSGGASLWPYFLLASTNLALPAAQWMSVASNQFDMDGNFAVTNAVNPSWPQTFYRLELQ